MIVNRPTLHPMAAAALKSLEAKGLTPRPEHVLWLHDAAGRIRKASRRRVASLVDWPVPAGGSLLYPMSLAAFEWWRNLDPDQQESVFVQAFACSYSHDHATLKRLATHADVQQAVQSWYTSLTCSPAALSAALEVVMDGTEITEIPDLPLQPTKRKSDPDSYGAMVRALTKKYPGTTPQYWAWEVPMEDAFEALSEGEILAGEGQVTPYELEMNIAFRAIKAAIEQELTEAAQ